MWVINLRSKEIDIDVLVLSFKTSKLNQTVFNQGKLKSTSINLQERPRKRFLRVCDIMSAVLTTTS